MKKLVGIVIGISFLIAAAYVAGRLSGVAPGEEGHAAAPSRQDAPQESVWTCPMHPQIQLPRKVPCPICGMELVEKTRSELEAALAAGPRGISMSDEARALLEIETAPVQRRFVVKELRAAGHVALDPTRVQTVAARFVGRLERLFVDYEGMRVREGEHLAEIYSPALITAQQELIEAHRALRSTESATESEFLQEGRRRAYDASREKLRLWGLREEQVDAIVASGKPRERIQLQAPASGVVLAKMRNEGEYVSEGTAIYRIGDLSRLWILLDVYEQDLSWVHYGQRVWIEADALPGAVFEGTISFVSPTLDAGRRAVSVRVNVANEEGALKPGMLVRGRIQSRIAAGGRVMDARLAGKWISPMHPEIVKDGPGSCDICGMPLVPAEELGYVRGEMGDKPLVVPASAVLRTGTRAIAYVAVPGKEKPTYEGREVDLGARAGDWYVVKRGLREGERVVVHGAFMIDSALQIEGKPSMMSLPGRHDDFSMLALDDYRKSMQPVFAAYFRMQEELFADEAGAARESVRRLGLALGTVQDQALPSRARELWRDELAVLERSVAKAGVTDDLETLRGVFEEISRSALFLARSFGPMGPKPWYEAYCPMAFRDKGAYWLQDAEKIRNPYEGSRMPHCGEITERFGTKEDAPGRAEGEETEQEDAPGQDEGHAPLPDTRALKPVFAAYLSLQDELYRDDLGGTVLGLAKLADAVAATAAEELPEAAQEPWATAKAVLQDAGKQADPLVDLDAIRVPFERISLALLEFVESVGHPMDEALARAHCPMAFDNRGADWLQRGERVNNPYEGARMPHCGSIRKRYPARGGDK